MIFQLQQRLSARQAASDMPKQQAAGDVASIRSEDPRFPQHLCCLLEDITALSKYEKRKGKYAKSGKNMQLKQTVACNRSNSPG
eukprot:1157565-Pelagomonas_calceolata.AAC.14